jgi:hypothetical protein
MGYESIGEEHGKKMDGRHFTLRCEWLGRFKVRRDEIEM